VSPPTRPVTAVASWSVSLIIALAEKVPSTSNKVRVPITELPATPVIIADAGHDIQVSSSPTVKADPVPPL